MTGALARRGLDYDSVRKTNPGVVYCSITGFGSAGGAGLAGYDFIVQAVGGLMSMTGDPDGDPTKVGVALVDVLTAKDAVIAVLAALRERESSGRGQRIEVNLLSSLLGSLVNQVSGYLTTGRPPQRMGNQHPSIAPYETLRAADGPLAVACGNDGQFGRLAAVLGRPELATDPRFAGNSARVAHRAELIAELEAALAAAPAETWQERLREAGVPAGVVADVAGAVALADRLGLDPTWEVAQDRPRQVSYPARYSRFQPVRGTPPPALGEHDAEVRAWLCGDRDAALG
jgi:formyl-CoA transferase